MARVAWGRDAPEPRPRDALAAMPSSWRAAARLVLPSARGVAVLALLACCASVARAARPSSAVPHAVAAAPPSIGADLRLVPPRPEYRRYGECVASDGRWLAVGAPTGGDDAAMPGFVEVWRVLPTEAGGGLAHAGTLTAAPPALEGGYRFGCSVAVADLGDGGCLVAVGACDASSTIGGEADFAGRVEIWRARGGPREDFEPAWTREAVLAARRPEGGAEFGAAVAFYACDPSLLAVGSPRADGADGSDAFDAGLVEVFAREDGAWRRLGAVRATEPTMSAWFGRAVAFDDGLLACGAPGARVATGDREG